MKRENSENKRKMRKNRANAEMVRFLACPRQEANGIKKDNKIQHHEKLDDKF